jgi:hypothetical protein
MKKYIFILIILLIPIYAYAEPEIAAVDHYEGNIGYSEYGIIKNTWAYDVNTNKYVKFDQNGYKLYELTNPNDDPMAKKGKINIKVNMPNNLKDEKVVVSVSCTPYDYTFTLDKNNNFNINEPINAESYDFIDVYLENDIDKYPIDFPDQINVYENQTTYLNLDYSKYKQNVETEKKVNKNQIILYAFGGLFLLAILIIGFMFSKAKNI